MDILQLARLFAARHGKPQATFSFSFMVALIHHDWPFNVRELESCIKRAGALAAGDVIDVGQLPDSIASLMREYGKRPGSGTIPPERRESKMPPPFSSPLAGGGTSPPANVVSSRRPPPSEEQLRDLLTRHRGNIAAVGRELGKERMQVHRWMKRYGISVEEYRD